jgi:hypothetical protein
MTVLLAFGADLAWNLAGAFWGFSLLALLVVWVALHQLHVTTANTSKTVAVEQRLNATVAATAPAVNLVANGGTIGGDVTVQGNQTFQGDVHVDGSLFGTGGTLSIGDTARFNATGNGPSGGNTFLGLTNSQATFLASINTAGGVTPPSTSWGGGAGCSLTTGNFNTNALSGLNQLEDAINELITALVAMNLLT